MAEDKKGGRPDSLEALIKAVNAVAATDQPDALKLMQIADLSSGKIDPAADSIASFINTKAKQELDAIKDSPEKAFSAATPAQKTIADIMSGLVEQVKNIKLPGITS